MTNQQRVYQFYDNKELMTLPPQKWLIRDILREEGLGLLFGPPGEGKSFVALDWALCVATGKPWLDKFHVQRGHVLYIAAEGGGGIKRRVAAWQQLHCIKDVPEITWYLDTLNVFEDGAIEAFMDQLIERFPTEEQQDIDTGEWTQHHLMDLKLVVIDTLSRNFGGQDENSNAMSVFVDRVEEFAKNHGALVLIVHHTNAKGDRERGHTALKAGMQVSFRCTATKENKRLVLVELDNNKQKDDPDADNIYMRPCTFELVGDNFIDDGGKRLTSLVLEACDKPEKKKTVGTTKAPVTGPLTATQMFRLLVASSEGLTDREWQFLSNLERSTYYRRRGRLKKMGLIEKREGSSRWFPKDSAQDDDLDFSDDDE